MIDISKEKWKYLRESENKYFDKRRNTSLKEYLFTIFPNNEFVFDKIIPKEITAQRSEATIWKRFRPDARCEELNLIIEYDGINHYRDTNIVLQDIKKDHYYSSLLYKVVHIPYWIQLSNEMIKHFFDINVEESMCRLKYSFSDTEQNDFGLAICPGSMCEAGRLKMLGQFNTYPKQIKLDIIDDLQLALKYKLTDIPKEWIVPDGFMEKLLGLV